MCRWMAYAGNPIPLEVLIFEPEHSLIDQSMSAKMAAYPTNGDGFGVGWYGRENQPAIYRSTQPAWNDANLRDLAFQIVSPMFLAHVRRSTGTPVQTSNCHPFRHDNWLFVHNGLLRGYRDYRLDMITTIAPELFPEINGTTDSELMFYLALTFGLESEPLAALERMAGTIERFAESAGVPSAIQMTLGIADEERLYAVRYSTEGSSRTLFHNESVRTVEALHPEWKGQHPFADHARVVVSEPLSDRVGNWIEVPESSALIIEAGDVEVRPFQPRVA